MRASADRTICSGLAVVFSIFGIGEAFVWLMYSGIFGLARWGGGLAAAATGALFGVTARWAHAREVAGLSW